MTERQCFRQLPVAFFKGRKKRLRPAADFADTDTIWRNDTFSGKIQDDAIQMLVSILLPYPVISCCCPPVGERSKVAGSRVGLESVGDELPLGLPSPHHNIN